MNNKILPQNLQSILDSCLKDIEAKSKTINNLTVSDRALEYYLVYKKNHVDAILLDTQFNGLSSSYYNAGIFFEQLSYYYFDILPTLLTTIHCYELIKSYADEVKKNLFLKKILNSTKPIAFCLTEDAAGSDISCIQTTAIRKNNSFIINGKKVIVINSGIASFYLVLAQSSKKGRAGLSAFLIPESTSGIQTKPLNISGFKNCVIGTVEFNNVAIDQEYQIGEEGSGYFLITEMLDKGRPFVASCCVGGALRALDIIIEHTKSRKQFTKTLYDFQGINFPIAEFKTRLHAARLLYLDACNKIDNNEPFSIEASMAKYYASRLFLDITVYGLDILGYKSIMESSEMKKLNDLAQAMMFIDGTENVQKMIIASLL